MMGRSPAATAPTWENVSDFVADKRYRRRRQIIQSEVGEGGMFVSIDDAEKDLADLVSKVEAGGEVILTRQGCAVVRLITVDVAVSDRWKRRAVIEAARALADVAIAGGDEAARTQDFLYADDGLPR